MACFTPVRAVEAEQLPLLLQLRAEALEPLGEGGAVRELALLGRVLRLARLDCMGSAAANLLAIRDGPGSEVPSQSMFRPVELERTTCATAALLKRSGEANSVRSATISVVTTIGYVSNPKACAAAPTSMRSV